MEITTKLSVFWCFFTYLTVFIDDAILIIANCHLFSRQVIIYIHFGNWLIDDVIVIDWTDSDFRISRALQPCMANFAIFYLQVASILPIKFHVNWSFGLRRKILQ